MNNIPIGIVGGSGLYHMNALEAVEEIALSTPFGDPSDRYRVGTLGGRRVAFLPRHGRHHSLLPSEIPHRANIWGFKKLGVRWLISLSAVGSLREKYAPGHFVIPLQFFDRTKNRDAQTFFGSGLVGHISFGQPVCEALATLLYQAASSGGVICHWGGTYVNMEGPAFSTRAESQTNHKLGYDVIGMTNLGEAKCAREAEISYATMAMVTDYDCWNEEHDHVTVEMVIECLHKNAATAKRILLDAIPRLPTTPDFKSHRALKNAIMTDKKLWPKKTVAELKPILAKYL